MAKDFLLEVGTEPLPARFVAPAAAQLARLLEEKLKASRFSIHEARSYATPRRLAVVFKGLSDKSSSYEAVDFGPPADRARDAQGNFTPAAEGFARKCGVAPGELSVENGPKGAQLAFKRTVPGETAEAALVRMIPALLAQLDFPKSLEWEPSRFRFGRPIRWLTALLGNRALKLEVAGVRSGSASRGLAALGQKPVKIASPARYAAALKDALVLADVAGRRAALEKKLLDAAKKAGARVDLDEALVDETVYMTEHPVPVYGSFNSDFLRLPGALLALVLKKQLKFFPLYEGSGLKAGFLGVRDGVSEGQELVREGYQRVLVARLQDAFFFFGRDRGVKLADRLPALSRVTYQKALGSMAEKSERVTRLAAALASALSEGEVKREAVSEIARLCYADLVTDVVREFPELQGVMGGVYARLEGLSERVALGLEEFYLPVGPKSPVPTTLEGALASLAGKLDSLAGSFLIGQIPTGSADPFALRRQALGAIRIVLEKQLPVDLGRALHSALALQPGAGDREKAARLLEDFAWARAQSFFEERGFRSDEVRAVAAGGLADLRRTYLRLCAVRDVRKLPDFEPLAAAFKRASNILKQAKIRPGESAPPERAGLKEQAELSLFDKLDAMEGQFREKLSQDGYEAGLRTLVAVKPDLDLFFEKVMVMAEDKDLRAQRLSLLARLVRLFSAVADLSELQPGSAN